jgi:hypothetical protein
MVLPHLAERWGLSARSFPVTKDYTAVGCYEDCLVGNRARFVALTYKQSEVKRETND